MKLAALLVIALLGGTASAGPGRAPRPRKQAFFRRYDLNRDGNIGPGEMPPALANELRPLDRDGDGWLQGNELP
jgi:hypothetical protein